MQRLIGGTADSAELLRELTPRHIVTELDRHIVGQHDAKRAVAIAIRNRWRRKQLADDMRPEVSPKNILMIGPTGVGKTEIARRLARLDRSTVHQGGGHEVHRSRILRTRRGEHGTGTGRERHRPGPRAGTRQRGTGSATGACRNGCSTCCSPVRSSTRKRSSRRMPSATNATGRKCAACSPPANWTSVRSS